MTRQVYTIAVTRSVRRVLAETLPLDVAAGAVDFFAGALSTEPYRVGKVLDAPLKGVRSARLMREWRMLYTVDDDERVVTVRAVLTGAMPTDQADNCDVVATAPRTTARRCAARGSCGPPAARSGG